MPISKSSQQQRPTANSAKLAFGLVITDQGVDASRSRRKYERMSCVTGGAIYEILADERVNEGCACTVRDLSQSGLGLSCRRMFNVGAQVIVLLRFKVGQSRPYFGIIRQCRYDGKALYALGVEFTPTVQSEAVTRWMIENQLGG
ncbi:MAG: PilZ domain-containing protein [Phycisphaerales bacterium]|nr:PilZ domain-containing protein [Phycisphaerales bacterium]